MDMITDRRDLLINPVNGIRRCVLNAVNCCFEFVDEIGNAGKAHVVFSSLMLEITVII